MLKVCTFIPIAVLVTCLATTVNAEDPLADSPGFSNLGASGWA